MALLEGLEPLVRAGVRQRLWPDIAPQHRVDLGREAVETLLPHRDPFLFVDRVSALDADGGRIRGGRFIAGDDPVFAGHFPGTPVYPGVLQLEMIGQMGLCLLRRMSPAAHRHIRAVKVHHAVFLREVGGGAWVDVVATVVRADEYGAICAGQVLMGDTICAFGVMEVFFVER
jgi:3-hydroxymyristoyl/3-hydroxydecanoyl-(acyl carrier protein) dehydratase